MWDPLEFGRDQRGRRIALEPMGRHTLFAGETGSGKTVAQSMLAATAALDPTARLFVLDPNEMLWRWEAVADRYVVDDMDAAKDALEFVLDEHSRRNGLRKEAGVDKWSRELAEGTGEGPIVILVDEAPEFLRHKVVSDLMRRVAARCRVSGVHLSLTVQYPVATVVDTVLRGQLGLRGVFRLADSTASRVALGVSTVDASTIAPEDRGVCYLHRDGELPVLMRTYYLTPEQVQALVRRAIGREAACVRP
jgi:DNA segregation ATPase FtsK/SpoIIIE-like protein